MGLNKEQQAAVEYLEGPLLVLAGPGTGKTQLLSAKVEYILTHTDTNPENILCLTFTESGASNMRERLGTMIGQAAAGVHIYTYHAFGSQIIERYKHYAENFNRQLDSPIDGVMQHKILREIQSQLSAIDILKTANIKDLLETIQNAKSARLSATDLQKIAEQNIADSTKLSEEISPVLLELVPRMKFSSALEQIYQPILEIITAHTSATPLAGNIEPLANVLARELHDIITTESAKEKPSISPLSKWKDRRFEKQDDGTYRLKDHIANRKLLSLSHIMQSYDDRLQAEGLFDFADMIEEAIRILKTDRGFRLSMSELFQYILLDEFQDTNPSQFEIIKLLTDYEKPVVMAVGDDDQAIFEFQGANASNLLDFESYYQAKVITLVDNYRSTSPILDFSHRVAEQVDNSFAKHHNVSKILRSMRDFFAKNESKDISQSVAQQKKQSGTKNKIKDKNQVQNPSSTIERHEFTNADHEYAWIAQKIAGLIEQGTTASDIAIIAPKHKYLGPLLVYLKENNINISYEQKSNLLEDPKIHELIVLAQFVDDLAHERHPEHRLLEILSFPCFEIEPLESIHIIESIKNSDQTALDALTKTDSPKIQNLATWLAHLVMRSFDTPLELWLDYLIGHQTIPGLSYTSPFLKFYSTHGSEFEQLEFYENLATLRSTIMSYTSNSKPKLSDFISLINDYTAADLSIVTTSIRSDDADSVQIMSAHKSKGLEFQHVFMIAVDENAWGKAKGNNTTFTLPSNVAPIRHTGITDDERLRLLFVAITRARDHLYMTNSLYDFNGKKTARLSYLAELRDEKNSLPISPYLPEPTQEIILHELPDEVEQIHELRNHWLSTYQVLTSDIKRLLLSRVENYHLTASDLTSFIDIIYDGPQNFYRRRILRAPDEPLTASITYGTLIHATFEQITSQGIDDQAALEFFQQKSAEVAFSPSEIAELQEKGLHDLKAALMEFGPLLRHPQARAEVNLHSEHPVLDGIPLTGKIDHLAIDPAAKTIEVYDFKTGKYRSSKWDSHPSLYKYRLQLGFYKLLLNLSPSYRNYRVTRGHILFVSPDDDGRVYDKVYEYNDADEVELKKLARAVYHQIKTLDFVSDDQLNLAADKARTIKDIKEFITLLIEQSLI